MSTSHIQIALAEALPGAVLADDVRDHHGHILLPKDTILTETLLISLARHAITSLSVRGADPSPEQLQAERAARAARVAHLFRKSRADGADAELQRLMHQFVLGEAT